VQCDGLRCFVEEGSRVKSFFDYLFDPGSTQRELYESIGKQMLSDSWTGYNSTCFAYGQTGSGKTFSMVGELGDDEKEGLLPRLVKSLFEKADDESSRDTQLNVEIRMSY